MLEGVDEFIFQRFKLELPKIDAHFNPWEQLFTPRRAPQRDGFTKICLVLHPVEVHVQILENARRDPRLAGDGDQC